MIIYIKLIYSHLVIYLKFTCNFHIFDFSLLHWIDKFVYSFGTLNIVYIYYNRVFLYDQNNYSSINLFRLTLTLTDDTLFIEKKNCLCLSLL